jgi:hypothetical protein
MVAVIIRRLSGTSGTVADGTGVVAGRFGPSLGGNISYSFVTVSQSGQLISLDIVL